MNKLPIFLCILLVLAGCQNRSKKTTQIHAAGEYAKNFRIEKHDNYTLLQIVNPWDTTALLGSYALTNDPQALPQLPAGVEIIQTPIQRVIASNTTQCENIVRLHGLNQIVGIFDGAYIQRKEIQNRIQSGKVKDLGPVTHANPELLISLDPQLIFTSPYENKKAKKKGLNMVEFPYIEYMEKHPLGQVEWIKVMGLLMDQPALADSLFNDTKGKYLALKELCKDVATKPTVFAEIKTGSSWYISGGQSYIAQIYQDAGASYIFANLDHSGAVPLSEEQVFNQAQAANFWLVKHHQKNAITYSELAKLDPLYSEFDAYKKQKIYLCNTSYKPYYEELSLYPDRLLSDFIALFHPTLLPNHQFHYYEALQP